MATSQALHRRTDSQQRCFSWHPLGGKLGILGTLPPAHPAFSSWAHVHGRHLIWRSEESLREFPRLCRAPYEVGGWKRAAWGGVGETGVLSEVACGGDGTCKDWCVEGVALRCSLGSELVFSPWRRGGACEAPVLYLICYQPRQPPCSWARPGAWRGTCQTDECLRTLIPEALARSQCPLSAGLGLSRTNNTNSNGSPLHPTARCQRCAVLCLAFPSHHLFFGWTPESFFTSRMMASVPVSKGQLLPAAAVSFSCHGHHHPARWMLL